MGILEHDPRGQGIDVEVRYHDTSGWYSNYRVGETTAVAQIPMKLNLNTRQLKSMTAVYAMVGSDLGSVL